MRTAKQTVAVVPTLAFSLLLACAPLAAHAQEGRQRAPDPVSLNAELPDAPSPLIAANDPPQQPAAAKEEPPLPCMARLAQTKTMTAEQLKAEESQYIAGVVPNFNTVFGECSPPLKPSQKMDLVYHDVVVPFTIGFDFILAGADELDGDHKGYGWGPGGYFKRAGAEIADSTVGAFVGNGFLPILLHQDPRYFQLGAGHPVMRRILHAAASDFVCLGDNGRRQFNFSNIGGNIIAGGISNLYYPSDERGVGLTFTNAAKVTLEGSIGSQLLEFSPELSNFVHRLTHHGNNPPKPAAPAPAP